MDLSVIGINHRTAPVEVRETFALTGELGGQLLKVLRAAGVFDEALVLDTCNRTEIYFVSRSDDDPMAHIMDHVGRVKGAAPPDDTSAFYRHDGQAAVRHLFRVAAALDSQIVGEHQVLGQVRAAYRQAVEARTAGFLVNKLLHAALRAGKRTQSETQLGRGSASVAQAAVDLAGQVFTDLGDKTVLLVGAGQTAETAARRLIAPGVRRMIVANRTLANAERLAEALATGQIDESDEAGNAPDERRCPAGKVGTDTKLAERSSFDDDRPSNLVSVPSLPALQTRAIELGGIGEAIARADLVICSTGSTEPVLTVEALEAVIRKRTSPLLIVDIAVPRDVEGELGNLPNVFLYNMNDLDAVVAQNIERRRQEIPRAEAIVDHETALFMTWYDSRQAAATITLLQRRFDLLRRDAIKRYGGEFAGDACDRLDPFTKGLCNKMLHGPIVFLKELAARGSVGEQLAAVDAIRRMFDLDELEEDDA